MDTAEPLITTRRKRWIVGLVAGAVICGCTLWWAIVVVYHDIRDFELLMAKADAAVVQASGGPKTRGGGVTHGRRDADRQVHVYVHHAAFDDARMVLVNAVLLELERAPQVELISLDVSNTAITDRSLAPLREIKKLAVLNVSGTHVTAPAALKLAHDLPQLHDLRFNR